MSAGPRPRVLCVDDEPAVLQGLELHLRRRFDVVSAVGPLKALDALRAHKSFAVVMSDMRMPNMSGAELLKQVRQQMPEATRLLLTGYSDLESAITAVNEGQIFRFLTKPCPPPLLLQAMDSALAQHQLVIAERVLLEQTLRGTVKMLADVLALANPLAFGRASSVLRHTALMLATVAPHETWKAEMACLFSQLGAINLPTPLLEKWYRAESESYTPDEKERIDKLPQAADGFLGHIPRLDEVKAILHAINCRFDGGGTPALAGNSIPVGARALRIAFDLEAMFARGDSTDLAVQTLKSRTGWYDLQLLETVVGQIQAPAPVSRVREVSAKEIRAGMVLTEDVKTKTGMLLVPRGFEVTEPLAQKFQSYAPGSVKEPIRVLLPPDPPAAVQAA